MRCTCVKSAAHRPISASLTRGSRPPCGSTSPASCWTTNGRCMAAIPRRSAACWRCSRRGSRRSRRICPCAPSALPTGRSGRSATAMFWGRCCRWAFGAKRWAISCAAAGCPSRFCARRSVRTCWGRSTASAARACAFCRTTTANCPLCTATATCATPSRRRGWMRCWPRCSACRERAAQLIRTGAVEVDHVPAEDGARALSAPCTLSVRGHGRFLVYVFGPPTKKGRLTLAARQCI